MKGKFKLWLCLDNRNSEKDNLLQTYTCYSKSKLPEPLPAHSAQHRKGLAHGGRSSFKDSDIVWKIRCFNNLQYMSLIMWKYGTPQFHWLAHFSLDISYSLHRIGRRCYGLQTCSDQPLFEQAGVPISRREVLITRKRKTWRKFYFSSVRQTFTFSLVFWCMYIYIYIYTYPFNQPELAEILEIQSVCKGFFVYTHTRIYIYTFIICITDFKHHDHGGNHVHHTRV